jgi:hypothetical protein
LLTTTRRDDSVDEVIRRPVLRPAQKQQRGVGMALHIDRNLALADMAAVARVLDLGCRRMALRRFLPNGCGYQGCDLVAREADTVACDFNAGERVHRNVARVGERIEAILRNVAVAAG